tara:strand:+ start:382 stop:795 length:414 start_codon:yes stop_codon:yes gene_type:complete
MLWDFNFYKEPGLSLSYPIKRGLSLDASYHTSRFGAGARNGLNIDHFLLGVNWAVLKKKNASLFTRLEIGRSKYELEALSAFQFLETQSSILALGLGISYRFSRLPLRLETTGLYHLIQSSTTKPLGFRLGMEIPFL